MKKLIKFLLVLAFGAFLGYVFHDTIDNKMKSKLGDEKVEQINSKTKKFAEKAGDVGKAAYEAGKEALNSPNQK